MKLGIMQPYFFPYLGYYDLIARTDRWVVFDTVKYVPKSWINRNRILHPEQGWQYVTVPVDRHAGDRSIGSVLILDPPGTARRVLGQLQHYRNARAPYFSPVRALVERAFDEASSARLSDLNVRSLELVCEYLGIGFDPIVLSQTPLELPPIRRPGDWALEISSALGASEYVNPPNGRTLFSKDAFESRGITLTFTDLVDYRYDCGPYRFVDHLSIIDVLMWNPSEAVAAYLRARAQAVN